MKSLLIVGIVGIILIIIIYKKHDCLGKKSLLSVDPPTEEDPTPEYIDKLREMMKQNYKYSTWEISLLAALIASLPIVYFLKRRLPTLFELFIVSLFIFIGTYYSFSWLWTHFYYPNSRQIERNLVMLRDRVTSMEGKRNENVEIKRDLQ